MMVLGFIIMAQEFTRRWKRIEFKAIHLLKQLIKYSNNKI